MSQSIFFLFSIISVTQYGLGDEHANRMKSVQVQCTYNDIFILFQ